MDLWRISNHDSLDGRGGLFAPARWHSRGHPIVYLATTPAGALVEALVHLELHPSHLPVSYQLMKVRVPEHMGANRIESTALPRNWPNDLAVTRSAGDDWLASEASALLEVPSAILPETSNLLLNPNHPDARQVRVLWHVKYPYDPRFFSQASK